jgi:hypothetical protein
VALELQTARGMYRLELAGASERLPGAFVVTLALERGDGIEKVLLRCRIASSLLCGAREPETILKKLRPWIEREFEMTREYALKSIRSERKLLELSFDESNRGPF